MEAGTIPRRDPILAQRPWLPMWLGLALLLGIVVHDLATQLWMMGQSDYGPMVLAAALWVLYRERHAILDRPGGQHPWLATALLSAGLFLFVVGRAQDILFFEAGALLLALPACLLAYGGWPSLKASGFALPLLALFVPHPAFVVDALTAELKTGVSLIAEWGLHALDYPVGRDGVILTVGQYRLLVADACSGMRSIFSLSAVGLLYLYLMRHADFPRNAALLACVIPIAVLANALRVVALALITYHFGYEAGQGYAHGLAHVLLFLAAVGLLVGLDRLLGAVFFRRATPAPATREASHSENQ